MPGFRKGKVPPKMAQSYLNEDVIRDAIRLLGWGRDWHELPSAISRMSGRPAATRVRQILKANRAHIEKQASERAGRH